MHVVVCSYHRSPGRAARYVSYMSHREERLCGETRDLRTFGDRYNALARAAYSQSDLESALRRQLVDDARGGRPAYFRAVFTVDDRAAAALRAMPREVAEQRLRTAFQGALRGTAATRRLEGVYVVHWHGGNGRPAHPHVHAICSPVATDGRAVYLNRRTIEKLRETWGRELNRSLRLTPAPERVRRRAERAHDRQEHERTRGQAPALRAVRAAQDAVRYASNPVRAAAKDVTRATVRSLIHAATNPGPARSIALTVAAGPRAAAAKVATKVAAPVAAPATIALAIARSALTLARIAAREI